MLRVGGFVRMIRINLGLDVEAHVTVAGAAHQLEHLGERGYSGAGHGELVRKTRRVVAAGTNLADIVLFDLGERQFARRECRAGARSVRPERGRGPG